MKLSMLKLFLLGAGILLLTSCFLKHIGGPAFPQKMAKEYFEKTGEDPAIAAKVINRKKMPDSDFIRFSQSEDKNVRYLIAANRYIPIELLRKMANDHEFLVRQGAAHNTSIDEDTIAKLMNDPVLSVVDAIASNPVVPEDVILSIYNRKNRKASLESFASNPNCPQSIRQDILKSNDKQAKEWLKITDDGKREGVYDKNGIVIDKD